MCRLLCMHAFFRPMLLVLVALFIFVGTGCGETSPVPDPTRQSVRPFGHPDLGPIEHSFRQPASNEIHSRMGFAKDERLLGGKHRRAEYEAIIKALDLPNDKWQVRAIEYVSPTRATFRLELTSGRLADWFDGDGPSHEEGKLLGIEVDVNPNRPFLVAVAHGPARSDNDTATDDVARLKAYNAVVAVAILGVAAPKHTWPEEAIVSSSTTTLGSIQVIRREVPEGSRFSQLTFPIALPIPENYDFTTWFPRKRGVWFPMGRWLGIRDRRMKKNKAQWAPPDAAKGTSYYASDSLRVVSTGVRSWLISNGEKGSDFTDWPGTLWRARARVTSSD